jgi:hypothetical protein
MKTSTKVLSASIVLASFYYFYRAKPVVPAHSSEPKEQRVVEDVTAPVEAESETSHAPKMKLHPMNNHTVQATAPDSEPTPEGEPSPESVAGDSSQGQAKPEVQSDSEIEGHLNEKISADARVQRVADILSVNCQSGTCVVRAQAKPDLEQEVQMAFILFQKEHPEFGSNFRMEPNPDDPTINNFVYTKDNSQPAPTQMEPISTNPPTIPQVTR